MGTRDWMERRAGGAAALYDDVVGRLDRLALAAARRDLLQDVTGAVLELGCGTGSGFGLYPATARVTAVEPEPAFRPIAASRAHAAAAEVSVLPGDAHDLSFPDDSFDIVVAELMLCSVARPDVALREARRVLRPGGSLRLLEHVRHRRPVIGRIQDAFDPLWNAVEGRGCHIGRDTPRAVEAAGFHLERVATVPLPAYVDWFFPIVTVHARKS